MEEIKFISSNKSYWFKQINTIHEVYDGDESVGDIIVLIDLSISPKDLTPAHIVSLACLLAFLKNRSKKVALKGNQKIIQFFRDDLKIGNFFGEKIHVDSESWNIFNLWQIIDNKTYMYGSELEKYFKQQFFRGYDISLLSVILSELYENIKDHANAKGYAYSYIQYDEEEENIKIAFCDFGIGIPNCLEDAGITPPDNIGYIAYATQKGVTTKSSSHNAGFGLNTLVESCIRNSSNCMRIISNNELFYCNGVNGERNEKTYKIDYNFKGTLIYIDLDINKFEREEIIGSANLFEEEDW